ncbi:MAG: nucleotidyltransferase family protein [Oscillospiraceae bacterium]|jgi:predicted nucleotidyltransferase|nr:nucleotidyltransferase family protein [Oscillospiraceae bacterium]
MKTVGIICEYNPFHFGHQGHIKKTKELLGEDVYIVCVMSGNFVQRGDFAIFNKHARAKAAVLSGADLVIDLPTPYVLSSAAGYAKAGIHLLDKLGMCDYLSFGSEIGDISLLKEMVEVITSEKAQVLIKEWLSTGVSYAVAQQKAAYNLMGRASWILKSPNNVLGVEYLKALSESNSKMQPITVLRTGGDHDSDTGYSASAVRSMMLNGKIPSDLMPESVINVLKEEIKLGRGPVSMEKAEHIMMSRLRNIEDFSNVPGASDGLDRRLAKFVAFEPTFNSLIHAVKTRRYVMSRIRRTLFCAALGITLDDVSKPPPYLRQLAVNNRGINVLVKSKKVRELPIIVKPATAKKLCEFSQRVFDIDVKATDFYSLLYDESERSGGKEWRQTPRAIHWDYDVVR